jgi:glutaryl-CoA dehydrogenase
MNTPTPPLTDHLADARATDYFFIREQLSDAQLDALRRVHALVDDEVLPVIAAYWERAEMPWSLIRRIGELGIVGEDIEAIHTYEGTETMQTLIVGRDITGASAFT